jgi:hypothetical protein
LLAIDKTWPARMAKQYRGTSKTQSRNLRAQGQQTLNAANLPQTRHVRIWSNCLARTPHGGPPGGRGPVGTWRAPAAAPIGWYPFSRTPPAFVHQSTSSHPTSETIAARIVRIFLPPHDPHRPRPPCRSCAPLLLSASDTPCWPLPALPRPRSPLCPGRPPRSSTGLLPSWLAPRYSFPSARFLIPGGCSALGTIADPRAPSPSYTTRAFSPASGLQSALSYPVVC